MYYTEVKNKEKRKPDNMKKYLKEFKAFALKGNVLDLAVGVIIGGAFGKIVSSLVGDVIMPLFGLVTGRTNLPNLKYVVIPATGTTEELAIRYGAFLQTIIDFLIISVSIFFFIKFIGTLKSKLEKEKEEEEEREKEEPSPSAEVALLTEIRDLIKDSRRA